VNSEIVLKIENISKLYRLGTVGTGTFGGDVQRFWKTKILGQEDPYLKIGQTNDRTSKEKADFVWALQDINFEVKRGEVLGIIGKNGAGKSTLLKLLSRITSPTTGAIKSAGRMASLLEVGTGFHPELTGRENIFLNGAILGMTKKEIQSKFDEIVDFSGCELYIDTPTKRYSSGMTVRLGFAVAAFLDPEILVVDEVLAVGDAEFQKKAIGKMKDVSKEEGRTVLFVSHNLKSVAALCPKSILIENGKIAQLANTKEVINTYLNGSSREEIQEGREISISTDVTIKNLYFGVDPNRQIILQGEEIELNIIILNKTEKNLDLSFSMEFKNSEGYPIFSLGNEFDNKQLKIERGINNIKVLFGICSIREGEYIPNVFFRVRDIAGDLKYYEENFSTVVVESKFPKSKEWRSFVSLDQHGYWSIPISKIN
jgi:lipopolysaccharide transport system ATP-binding protein